MYGAQAFGMQAIFLAISEACNESQNCDISEGDVLFDGYWRYPARFIKSRKSSFTCLSKKRSIHPDNRPE